LAWNYLIPRGTNIRSATESVANNFKFGDLVFFRTCGRNIGHVGFYLGNGRFVHSRSYHSGGVAVSWLDEPYYRRRYVGAVRLDELTHLDPLAASKDSAECPKP